MIVPAYYWRNTSLIKNLGDMITEVIIEEKGHQYKAFVPSEDHTCYVMVGSLLGNAMLDHIECNKIVWGSGWYGDPNFFMNSKNKNFDFRAVRGPLTRKHLQLPESFPVGDPALLLPRFKTFEKRNFGTSYIPHFSNKYRLLDSSFARMGAEKVILTDIIKSDFWNTIEQIANSEFVLTSSLHGAIIAQAYGVPWAAIMPREFNKGEMLFEKWQDWFAYLEIEPFYAFNLTHGKTWWEQKGHKGIIRDLDALDNAFPISQN